MENKDAIYYLLYIKHHVIANSPNDIALDMAIEALKEAAKKPKTNGDRIRDMMNDHYIADVLFCAMYDECCDCPLNAIDGECTDGQARLEWLKQEVQENDD